MAFAVNEQTDRQRFGAFVRPPVNVEAEILPSRAALVALANVAGPEKAGDPVVVALEDGIEFVIVATRALHGQPEKSGGRCVHHVLESCVEVVGWVVRFVVPGPGADHAGGDDRLFSAIGHLVTG